MVTIQLLAVGTLLAYTAEASIVELNVVFVTTEFEEAGITTFESETVFDDGERVSIQVDLVEIDERMMLLNDPTFTIEEAHERSKLHLAWASSWLAYEKNMLIAEDSSSLYLRTPELTIPMGYQTPKLLAAANLAAHWDRFFLHHGMHQHTVFANCVVDRMLFCPDTAQGGFQLMQCLNKNREDLSTECAERLPRCPILTAVLVLSSNVLLLFVISWAVASAIQNLTTYMRNGYPSVTERDLEGFAYQTLPEDDEQDKHGGCCMPWTTGVAPEKQEVVVKGVPVPGWIRSHRNTAVEGQGQGVASLLHLV
jgi:hypothetical protein